MLVYYKASTLVHLVTEFFPPDVNLITDELSTRTFKVESFAQNLSFHEMYHTFFDADRGSLPNKQGQKQLINISF